MKVKYYKNGSVDTFEGTIDEWKAVYAREEVSHTGTPLTASPSAVIPIFLSSELRRNLPDWDDIYLTKDFDGWWIWSKRPVYEDGEWLEPVSGSDSLEHSMLFWYIEDEDDYIEKAKIPDDLPDEKSIFKIVDA